MIAATFGSGGPNGMPPAPPMKPPANPVGDGAFQSTSLTSSAVCCNGPAAPPPAPPTPSPEPGLMCTWSKWLSTCHSVLKPSLWNQPIWESMIPFSLPAVVEVDRAGPAALVVPGRLVAFAAGGTGGSPRRVFSPPSRRAPAGTAPACRGPRSRAGTSAPSRAPSTPSRRWGRRRRRLRPRRPGRRRRRSPGGRELDAPSRPGLAAALSLAGLADLLVVRVDPRADVRAVHLEVGQARVVPLGVVGRRGARDLLADDAPGPWCPWSPSARSAGRGSSARRPARRRRPPSGRPSGARPPCRSGRSACRGPGWPASA